MTAQEFKSWNGLAKDTLAAGQKLRVTSDVVPGARRRAARTKRAVATKGAGKQAKSAAKSAPAKPAPRMRASLAPSARVAGQSERARRPAEPGHQADAAARARLEAAHRAAQSFAPLRMKTGDPMASPVSRPSQSCDGLV